MSLAGAGGTPSPSGGAAGSSGAGAPMCGPGTADCDEDTECESDFTSNATCGESCADMAACDTLSAATCVNGGCSNLWAAWPMPNGSANDETLPNPASYADNGDGTVTDQVTGLVWQQVPPAESYVWSAAAEYCAGLSLGGHADWRLPSRIELISIFSYGDEPSIPVSNPPQQELIDIHYWSSTLWPGSDARAWWVEGTGYTLFANSAEEHEVRCVR